MAVYLIFKCLLNVIVVLINSIQTEHGDHATTDMQND